MSAQGQAPSLPKSLLITGDPALDGLILKGILLAATAATPWLMSHLKLSDPSFAIYLTGALVSVLGGLATFVWGFINSRVGQAKAVQAGINLATAGKAIMVTHRLPPWEGPNAPVAKPLPVTTASAQEIIKDYADKTVTVPVK